MSRIAIAPANRLRRLCCSAGCSVPMRRARSGDRREDAAGEQVAFDLRKPEFDLIQPRRVRRGEIEAHVSDASIRNARTACVLCVDRLSSDHVNRARARLRWPRGRRGTRQTRRWCGAARSARRTSPDLRIERGEQRQRPVSVVLEAVALGASRRQRQHRVQPVQRLNRRLFVDREHGRMLRRIQVQPDHVSRFAFRSPDRPTPCSARTDAAATRRAATRSRRGCG